MIVAVVVLVLAMAGFGTAVTVARLIGDAGNEAGSSGAMTTAWTLPYPGERNARDEDSQRLFASWVTADLLVRVEADGVLAYRLSDGSQAWGVPLPEGMSTCSASPEADGSFGAISYGTDTLCDRVAGVDLGTGKLSFQQQLPIAKRDVPGTMRRGLLVAVGGGTVVVNAATDLLAFRAQDGTKLWERRTHQYCQVASLAVSATAVVAGVGCSPYRVVSLQLASGRPMWQKDLQGREMVRHVVSATPAVVLVSSISDQLVRAYSDKGAVTAEIPAKDGQVSLSTLPTGNAIRHGIERYAMFADASTVYAATDESRAGGGEGQVAAFDVATGKRRWLSSGHRGAISLIRADEQGLLGLERGGFDGPSWLVRLDAATGQRTVVRDASLGFVDFPLFGDFEERDGTLLVMPQTNDGKAPAVRALR
ncbi:outer membrane protein assembly factor BamB family protein [Spirilliplanes yamanashiensis]|uniref:outer membrane protein assembly factor BamB family protein n=1 Tax=Spirilliplanes yamanashiensis TaxID=42233 RepID=UPI001950B590|nr:PQQ-binding-like beta-propeller repeat protein [Spirilliplanes yamanashiensis]MDP9815604.1 outer membrane protein assembly factor BamB [Spirilliplanes yamanashiensis]